MVRPEVKSALTVAAFCGLIAAAVYPIVVVSWRVRRCRRDQGPGLSASPLPAAANPAAPTGMHSAHMPPSRLPLQVPLQDRSTREAPAGGFSKGSMWSNVDSAARSK